MKKSFINIGIAALITGVVSIVNYITAVVINQPIFALATFNSNGTKYIGVGVDLIINYPLNTAKQTAYYTTINFDALTFFSFFLITFIIVIAAREHKR